MQLVAMPINPEPAVGNLGKTSRISKIMKLEEKSENSRAAKALLEFEKQIKVNKVNL